MCIFVANIQVETSPECLFDDAFLVHGVLQDYIYNSHYGILRMSVCFSALSLYVSLVAGCMPYLNKYIRDRSRDELSQCDAQFYITALSELNNFMLVDGIEFVIFFCIVVCIVHSFVLFFSEIKNAKNCFETMA